MVASFFCEGKVGLVWGFSEKKAYFWGIWRGRCWYDSGILKRVKG